MIAVVVTDQINCAQADRTEDKDALLSHFKNLLSSSQNRLDGSALHSTSEVEILNLLVNRLDALLGFIESQADKFNLDGLFGLRVAEGNMQTMVSGETLKLKFKRWDSSG